MRLAVVEACDLARFLQFVGQTEPPLIAVDVYRWLASQTAITLTSTTVVLESAVAASVRDALRTADFLHFCRLHEVALVLWAETVDSTPSPGETTWLHLFSNLAESLVNRDSAQLHALVVRWQDLPLSPSAQRKFTFYQGLATFWQGQYVDTLRLLANLAVDQVADPALRGRTQNLCALCHFYQAAWQQALDGFRASLAVAESLGDQLQAGKVRLNMGVIYYELHDYAAAKAQLEEAADRFQSLGAASWLSSVHHELALVYRQQGEWDAAIDYFQRCIAQRQAEDADEFVGIALNNIGEIWLLQGEMDKALVAFQQALDKIGSPAHRIDVLVNLGLYYEIVNELKAAAQTHRSVLALIDETDRHEMAPTVHYRLGIVAQRQHDLHTAQAHWQRGIALIEANRAPMQEEGLKIGLLGRWQQIYEAMVLASVELDQSADAFAYTEQARARAFLELITSARSADAERATADSLGEAQLSLKKLQQVLPHTCAIIAFFITGQPGTHAELLDKLPTGAAPIRDHLLPAERLLAFVVTAEHITAVPLDIPLGSLQAQYFQRADGRLRGVTPLPGRQLAPLRRWQDLARRLLSPLAPYLAGKSHLYFIPHGLLHYLPLHALTDLDQLTGTIGTTVSYAPSAAILYKTVLSTSPAVSKTEAALTVGVDADGLAYAAAEANWLAQLLGGEPLLGAAATRQAVLAALPRYDIVHVSCHGHFRRREPMDSALQLYDGEITAADLLQAEKLSADLVTLSACDTGLNHLHPGDEMMGLTRAFLGQGVRSLIVTLWPVHEVPTRLLMEQFYLRWRAGASKAEALRHAQEYVSTLVSEELAHRLAEFGMDDAEITTSVALFQEMSPDERPFGHPYYWAAFLLVGG